MAGFDDGEVVSRLTELWISRAKAYGSAPGGAYHAEPDCEWYETAIDFSVFNTIFVQRFTPETADRRIRELTAALAAKGRAFGWLLLPGFTPADMADRLTSAGARLVVEINGMALRMGELAAPPPLPSDVQIVEATTEAQIREYARIYPLLFGAPTEGWVDAVIYAEVALFHSGTRFYRYYLAIDGGKAVAAASTCVHDDWAGLETLLTLPEYRNRGIGAALATHALAVDRDAGCTKALVWAGPGADGLYRRMGFRNVANAHAFER